MLPACLQVCKCVLYQPYIKLVKFKVITHVAHQFTVSAFSDNKTRPKREAPITGGRPGSTAIRDNTFGRPEREVPRRDRALRDSWQSSSALGSSTASSYRPAPAGRGSRAPPDRLPSDNSRSSLDNTRDSFAPSTSSSRAVFRTQSGPPLRDREDFGFGSGAGSYHDAPAFKPAAPRGVPLTGRGPIDKVSMQLWLVLMLKQPAVQTLAELWQTD